TPAIARLLTQRRGCLQGVSLASRRIGDVAGTAKGGQRRNRLVRGPQACYGSAYRPPFIHLWGTSPCNSSGAPGVVLAGGGERGRGRLQAAPDAKSLALVPATLGWLAERHRPPEQTLGAGGSTASHAAVRIWPDE